MLRCSPAALSKTSEGVAIARPVPTLCLSFGRKDDVTWRVSTTYAGEKEGFCAWFAVFGGALRRPTRVAVAWTHYFAQQKWYSYLRNTQEKNPGRFYALLRGRLWPWNFVKPFREIECLAFDCMWLCNENEGISCVSIRNEKHGYSELVKPVKLLLYITFNWQ